MLSKGEPTTKHGKAKSVTRRTVLLALEVLHTLTKRIVTHLGLNQAEASTDKTTDGSVWEDGLDARQYLIGE